MNIGCGDTRMKQVAKIVGIALGIIVLSFLFLWRNNDIGISKKSIEKDARESSNIKDDWECAMDTSDIISAMVFYPKDKSDHSFQIYVNRPGLSFGFFFRSGGDSEAVKNYIAEFTFEGYNDRVFISLNTPQVEKMEIDNGDTIEVIDIDSTKPFAIVLPKNIGDITFFDINENIVDTKQ